MAERRGADAGGRRGLTEDGLHCPVPYDILLLRPNCQGEGETRSHTGSMLGQRVMGEAAFNPRSSCEKSPR